MFSELSPVHSHEPLKMRSSKLLDIVHTESSLGWGGQEIRILTESAALSARGHRIELLCPAESRIFGEAPRFGVRATACPIARKGPKGLWHFRSALVRRKIDVLNTHSSTDSWLAALACATLAHAPPIVRTRHISAALTPNPATRWLYASATRHVVTTGERLREQVIREAGVAEPHVTSVPTGVDLARFVAGNRASARRDTGLPQEKLVVGIVATLRSWKGHRYLIDAIAKLDRQDVHLVIVGDGPQRDILQDQASRVPDPSRISFVGNQNNVVPWLQSLDIFVLPSYANEGVPQAILQAMACALPVISTDVGSIGEVVLSGQTGLLVKPHDVDSLVEHISRLCDDSALRAALGQNARAFVLDEHSIERMADTMERIFLAVASNDTKFPSQEPIVSDTMDIKCGQHRRGQP
jgi:glycosyltransferase involved in cell wall biosynthesis